MIALVALVGLLGAAALASDSQVPAKAPAGGGGSPLPPGGFPATVPPGVPMDKIPPFGTYTNCDAALAQLDAIEPGISLAVRTALAKSTDTAALEKLAAHFDTVAAMYAEPYGSAAKVTAQCIRLRVAELKASKGAAPGMPSWWGSTGPIDPTAIGKDLLPYSDANGSSWIVAPDPEGVAAAPTPDAWSQYLSRGATGPFPPEIVAPTLAELYDAIEAYAATFPSAPGVIAPESTAMGSALGASPFMMAPSQAASFHPALHVDPVAMLRASAL